MRHLILFWFLLFSGAFAFAAEAPVFRVLPPAAGPSLLKNGGFQTADAWQKFGAGYEMAPGEGRNASVALKMQNGIGEERGAVQRVDLNRTRALPLTIRGWSRAQGVSGAPDSGYALYVDIVYNDGTPLWGQVATFATGTHDWEQAEVTIYPRLPIRSLSFYCLFRGHRGTVWFDDVSLHEADPQGESLLWEGAAVQGQKTFGSAQFLARDVAANSDVFSFDDLPNGIRRCAALSLSLKSELRAPGSAAFISGEVSSETPRDRAITLAYALPLDALGWNWSDDIRRSRIIEGREAFGNFVTVNCGATGQASLYPLAAVWGDEKGVAIGVDLQQPGLYRLSYHAGAKQLQIAYDFSLTPENNKAKFRFVVFSFNGREGFRGAWKKYTALFPQHFAPRTREQGLWMPFTDIAKVPNHADFQFKFKEGDNNVPFDDANGVLTFRYTEPMTWWMPMPKEMPRTYENALKVRDELAGKGNAMAKAAQTAAMSDAGGQPQLQFKDTPWCDGAVWSLNPNPNLPGTPNGASVHWNDDIEKRLYGADAKGVRDGEYLDSLEGYVTADLNFNRAHFAPSSVPLVFDTKTKKPALWKALAVWEFTRHLADDLHAMNKLTFANGVPYRFSFLCGQLDVFGTETDWFPNGKFQEPNDATLALWRTMAMQKPYLLLLNTRFEKLTPQEVETYFQRALFYGFWPGMFSHDAAGDPYFQNPAYYERDRALFKKYLPLIRRVAEAGWQPVTKAKSDISGVHIERFGERYFTVLNTTRNTQTAIMIWDEKRPARARELIEGADLAVADNKIKITLAPGRVALIDTAPGQ